MKTRITRRQMAGAMWAAAAVAQTPATAPSGPAAELQAARDQNQKTGETLGKVAVPLDTEPAFSFKA